MISALILAAGESKRMGRMKMLLPWGERSILGQVISILQAADIEDILVVTGSGRSEIEPYLAGMANVRPVFNPHVEHGEMLSSIQTGLSAMKPEARAALICLGDQPQVQEESVRRGCAAFRDGGSPLVVPSYLMRRGHPWLIARPLWNQFVELSAPSTARDFLDSHALDINYVNIDSSSVIEDLDTPSDYANFTKIGG